MNALHAEIKTTTIDMMVLTRLNARRIVAGKWASIVGQTLLLFVSIVPYLILRYFFGGMNLFAELLALGSLCLLSACLTAFNVGLSSNAAIIVRGILPLALAVGMMIFMIFIMEEFDEFLEFFALEDDNLAIFLGLVAGAIYLAWTAFGLGVAAIAPAAENHSTLNRLITLGTMAVIGVILYVADADADAVPFLIGAIAFPGLVLALCESNFLMPRVTLPFIRRGGLGKLLGIFLYPCWTSGVHFAALLSAIVLALGGLVMAPSGSFRFGVEEFTVLCSLLGSALFPAVFLALFQKRIKNRIGLYFAILIGSYALMLALIAVAESTNVDQAMWLFCWLPPVHLYMVDDSSFPETAVLVTSLIFSSLYLGTLLIHAWANYKTIRAAEEEATLTYLTPAKEQTGA